MARGGFGLDQPSPPMSEGYEYLHHDFSKNHTQPLPFTPPDQVPQQAVGRSWQVIGSVDDVSQNYGNPEEYEMAQPVRTPSTVKSLTSLTNRQTFYRDMRRFRTPPIPIASSPAGIRTRSGRAIGTPMSSGASPATRSSDSPRPAKRRRNNKSNADDPLVTEPLSVMTKDYEIPVADMMAYVSRNDRDRLAEADRKGKTPRPLNSFMCYRAAYKDRIKKWGKQGDNNQLISKVAGLSWAIEPEEVKEHYKECAKIEGENHLRAFPNYKFAPNKTPKKRARDDDGDSDPEWDGSHNCSGLGSKRRRAARHAVRELPRSLTTTPIDMYEPAAGRNPHIIPLEMSMVDPWGRPLGYPPPYTGAPIQYIPQHHYSIPYPTSAPAPVPPQQQYSSSRLISMPPTEIESLLEPVVGPKSEQAIDPGLEFSDSFALSSHDGQVYEVYPPGEHVVYSVGQHSRMTHPGEQMLSIESGQEWAAIPQAGIAFDDELDRWNGA